MKECHGGSNSRSLLSVALDADSRVAMPCIETGPLIPRQKGLSHP
jgi:hypothetical protein